MSTPKVWLFRAFGLVGLGLLVVAWTAPTLGAGVMVTLVGLFAAGLLFVTLGPRWQRFAFGVTGVGLVGYAGAVGYALLREPHAGPLTRVVGGLFAFGFVFFVAAIVIGGVRWARTGSPYPGGRRDPRLRGGLFDGVFPEGTRRERRTAAWVSEILAIPVDWSTGISAEVAADQVVDQMRTRHADIDDAMATVLRQRWLNTWG